MIYGCITFASRGKGIQYNYVLNDDTVVTGIIMHRYIIDTPITTRDITRSKKNYNSDYRIMKRFCFRAVDEYAVDIDESYEAVSDQNRHCIYFISIEIVFPVKNNCILGHIHRQLLQSSHRLRYRCVKHQVCVDKALFTSNRI